LVQPQVQARRKLAAFEQLANCRWPATTKTRLPLPENPNLTVILILRPPIAEDE
jgi:hypothetical protein